MSAEVLTLPGVKRAHEPSELVIAALEGMLEEARRGEIQCFGACTIDPDSVIATVIATSGLPQAHVLVAGSVYLLRRAEKNAGLE